MRPDRVVLVAPWLRGGGAQRIAEFLLARFVEVGVGVSVVVLFESRDYTERMRDICEVTELNARRTPLGMLKAALRLRQALERQQPSTVVSLLRAAAPFVWLALIGQAKRPRFVASEHMFPSLDRADARLLGPLELAAARAAYRRAAAVICPTEELAADVVSMLKVTDSQLVVIGHPRPRVRQLRRSSVPSSPLRVAAIGRLERQKGFDVALRALRSIAAPIHLRVIGAGTEMGRLIEEAAKVPRPHRVEFGGYRNDIGADLDWADVLVMPSRMEVFPVILLEAASAGTPVLAARAPGLRAVLGENYPGLLSIDDAQDWAAGLTRFAEDEGWRRSIVEAIDDWYHALPDAEAVFSQYRNVILEVA